MGAGAGAGAGAGTGAGWWPYTESRVESEVFELKGLDSRELLEHTEAGQGGLLPPPPGSDLLLLSGFWAMSEKY